MGRKDLGIRLQRFQVTLIVNRTDPSDKSLWIRLQKCLFSLFTNDSAFTGSIASSSIKTDVQVSKGSVFPEWSVFPHSSKKWRPIYFRENCDCDTRTQLLNFIVLQKRSEHGETDFVIYYFSLGILHTNKFN